MLLAIFLAWIHFVLVSHFLSTRLGGQNSLSSSNIVDWLVGVLYGTIKGFKLCRNYWRGEVIGGNRLRDGCQCRCFLGQEKLTNLTWLGIIMLCANCEARTHNNVIRTNLMQNHHATHCGFGRRKKGQMTKFDYTFHLFTYNLLINYSAFY